MTNRLLSGTKQLIALTMIVAAPTQCAPVSFNSVGHLLTSAQVVIVGTIQKISLSGTIAIVNISVLRTIKGSVAPGTPVSVTWPVQPSITTTSEGIIGATGVWFLIPSQSAAGWNVLPLVNGTVPMSGAFISVPSESPAGASDAASPEDKLGLEIATALQDPGTAQHIAVLIQTGSLDDLSSSVLLASWTQSSASTDARTSQLALAAAIRQGDSNALLSVSGLPPANLDTRSTGALSDAIRSYRQADDASITTLGKLSQPVYQLSIRSSAAYALRNLHTSAALPFLKALLDDPDQGVRYSAVTGIAAYAANLPVQHDAAGPGMTWSRPASQDATIAEYLHYYPSVTMFAKDEQTYIFYWKIWLAAHSLP